MYKLNQFGPEGSRYADIVVDGEMWTIGPNNSCTFTCKVTLYWEVHFYPADQGQIKRVGRWWIRNAASNEQGRSRHGRT